DFGCFRFDGHGCRHLHAGELLRRRCQIEILIERLANLRRYCARLRLKSYASHLERVRPRAKTRNAVKPLIVGGNTPADPDRRIAGCDLATAYRCSPLATQEAA